MEIESAASATTGTGGPEGTPEGFVEISRENLIEAFRAYSSKNQPSDDFIDNYKIQDDDVRNASSMWGELNTFFSKNGLTVRYFKNDDEDDSDLYEMDLFVNINGVNKFVGKSIFRMHVLSNFEAGDRDVSGRKESRGNSIKFDWTNVEMNGFGAAILMQLYIILLAAMHRFTFFDKDDCSALSLKGNRFNNILWSYFVANWSLMSNPSADDEEHNDDEPDTQPSQNTQDLDLYDSLSDEQWVDSQN